MPAVTSGKVLVTGANGYIAMWVVDSLLRQGFTVRATVRSADKGTHLKQRYASEYGDKLEVVVVEDITKEGAFDEAVKGVDAIEHTASPFHLNAVEPDELIVPAVKGTLGVLQSALAHGPNVKRIVVTASCASVLTALPEPRVFSEKDWNDAAVEEAKQKGRDALPIVKYRASKTLAEKAAWEFCEKNKSKISWELVVLNPPFVFGPVIHSVSSPGSLNQSMHEWFHTVFKGAKDTNTLAQLGNCWIDVRDLGEAHVKAIQVPEAANERIIVSAGTYKWQDWVSAAHSLRPSLVPEGNTSYDPTKAVHMIQYDTTKEAKIFGLKFRSKLDTTRDLIADFEARGWLN